MTISVNNFRTNVLHSQNQKGSFKGVLDGLEPKTVLKTFEEITQIYKESDHNEEISKYIAEKLKKANFTVEVKGLEYGKGQYTIVATRNVDKQKKNAVILQSHMDIVGVSVDEKGKSDGNTKKPIILERVSEKINGKTTTLIKSKTGEWLKAHNRTLGADDGLGVATMLSIAEDPKFKNTPLEMIFTTDEETGMYGAESIKLKDFYGRYLINMDSEKIDEITVGCAGVASYAEQKAVPMINIGDSNHKKVTISVNGANGGHSGVQIQEDHINPIKTVLSVLNDLPDIKLASIEGGTKFNAIPKDATATIYVPAQDLDKVIKKLNTDLNEAKQAHSVTDSNLTVNIKAEDFTSSADEKVVDPNFQEKLFRIAGKQIKSELITTYDKDHIKEEKNNKTSQNLGILKLKDGKFEIAVCSRSSDEKEALNLQKEVSSQLSELLDKQEVIVNASPIWQPKKDTLLEKFAVQAYQENIGTKPVVQTCHGGLESAIFVQKAPFLEQISVGPTVKEPHTENERLELSTVKPFYDWMTTLIDKLENHL
ncbi:MAG: M20/M25/M40 family metallo-hydrolase [Candidatus Gastranaerophilaceae bacterium]|jgi:dipeptidase D